MIITSLNLKSFRSFQGIEIPLDAPRVFIAGKNAAGKSSLREAIRYCLSGQAQGLDAKGSGSALLVPFGNGSTAVSASLTIQGLGTVERTWTPSGSVLKVQGFTGTTQAQQQALLDRLGTTDAFLQASLDSRLFLTLNHVNAKALILELLNVRIRLGNTEDAPVMTLEEIDAAYQSAFEDRKLAKKRLQAQQIPPKPTTEGMPKVADVDLKLAERRKELEALLSQTGSLTGQRATLERRQAVLLHPSRNFPPPSIPIGGRDLAAEIADLEERLGMMDVETAVLPQADEEPEVGSAARVTFLTSRAAALKAHQPKEGCVLDPDIACPVGRKAFTSRAKAIEAEVASLPDPSPEVAPDAPVDPRKGILDELSNLRGIQQQYQREAEAEERRVTELAEVETELSGLQDTTEQDAKITDLRERIQKGEGIRRQAEQHWRAVEAFNKAFEAQQALQAEVARLEEMVAVLGPSGVRVQALGEAMGSFESAVNTFTTPFGWTVKFGLEPWGVQVNERPIETYSASERFRVGIAIQLSVAAMSGLRFAVVDELDMLDSANRDVIGRLLYAAPLDQILILATREPSQPLPARIPNMTSYRLDRVEGRSVVVERA